FQAAVVVVLETEIVGRAEPEAVGGERQQPEWHLDDAEAGAGGVAELIADPGVVNGIEPFVPAVLHREIETALSPFEVEAEQIEIEIAVSLPAGAIVVEPAVAHSQRAADRQRSWRRRRWRIGLGRF